MFICIQHCLTLTCRTFLRANDLLSIAIAAFIFSNDVMIRDKSFRFQIVIPLRLQAGIVPKILGGSLI